MPVIRCRFDVRSLRRDMELQNEYVASGSFAVYTTRTTCLKAILGTCVGLAIVDRTARVGGLLHILLPEPVSGFENPESPKYATTGVPAFLKALTAQGARLDRMEAVVAGGALVGPVNEQDMRLDIGGRTAEIVHGILGRFRIPIQTSETGGFFTCTLELDLERFRTHIEPATPSDGIHAERKPPSAAEIANAVKSLKPIPQIALKILRMIAEDRSDIGQIAAEIRQDQVLTAKTLRVCNSAMFYNGNGPITSIDEALLLLGQDMLVKSVVSAAVREFFSSPTSVYSICKGGLFHHAIGTAVVAERLARFIGPDVSPGIAYTAGLLHDIGVVVLDQYLAGVGSMFYRQLEMSQRNMLEAERALMGIDHCQVGTLLAKKWAFSEDLIRVIGHHHHPEQDLETPTLSHVVHVADLIVTRFQSGVFPESAVGNTMERCRRIGLDGKRLLRFIDSLPLGVFGMNPELSMT